MTYRILITAPELAPAAMKLLAQHRAEVATMPLGATPEEVFAMVKMFRPQGIVSRTSILDESAIAAADCLRAVSKHGAGVDNIDVAACAARGIPVARTSGANAQSVAEHTAALMLALGRHLVQVDAGTKAGEWPRSGFIGFEFHGRTLGLLGHGEIARAFGRIASGIGMRVLAYSPSLKRGPAPEGVAVAGSLEALFSAADVISLHCPLTEQTRGLVGSNLLGLLPRHALVLNTARGAVIDEEALVAALRNGSIAGAGLDTFAVEPLPADSPLRDMANVLLTPHIAGSTHAAMERVALQAVQHLFTLLDGGTLPPGCIVGRQTPSSA